VTAILAAIHASLASGVAETIQPLAL
jgi:hypothetical protein